MIWSTNMNFFYCCWSISCLFCTRGCFWRPIQFSGKLGQWTWIGKRNDDIRQMPRRQLLDFCSKTCVECGMNRKGKIMSQFFKSMEGQCMVFSYSHFPVLSLVHSAFSRSWRTNFWNKSVCVLITNTQVISGEGAGNKKKTLKFTCVAVLLYL